MARIPLPYKTKNNLTNLLAVEQARRVTQSGGHRTNIIEIEQDLANYCGVTRDTIVMIKRNKNQPSLQLAMKICEYLEQDIESIFSLIDNPEYEIYQNKLSEKLKQKAKTRGD